MLFRSCVLGVGGSSITLQVSTYYLDEESERGEDLKVGERKLGRDGRKELVPYSKAIKI